VYVSTYHKQQDVDEQQTEDAKKKALAIQFHEPVQAGDNHHVRRRSQDEEKQAVMNPPQVNSQPRSQQQEVHEQPQIRDEPQVHNQTHSHQQQEDYSPQSQDVREEQRIQ